ncbi:MAG: BamA/TamA family outer membrane protein, partial [Bdellovibrionales bacterium]|nr:BamA/TamA family outer membrane protein [Bdellovibrionales bacterium]
HVVLREMLLSSGDPADPEMLEESLQRIRNLGIFSRVDGVFQPTDSGKMKVLVDVEEKWTLIPLMNFGGDSGVNYYALGVVDTNTFGHYFELGSVYINFGGTHSGLFWFRDRRFNGEKIKLGADVGRLARVRTLYDEGGDEIGKFIHDRRFIKGLVLFELHPYLSVGGSVEYRSLQVKDGSLDEEEQELNKANNVDINLTSDDMISWVDMVFGRLNSDGERQFGLVSEWSFGYSQLWQISDEVFTEVNSDTRAFILLPWRSNLGFRFKWGHTDSDKYYHQNYIGGFEGSRGYRDGRYEGRAYWVGNIEYRIPSYVSDRVIIQHTVFFDSGSVAENIWDLGNNNREAFHSAGLGLRFIPPQVSVIALRIDYAKTFEDKKEEAVSFGLQQYF